MSSASLTNGGAERVVVGAAIVRHEQVLLLRRSADDFMGGLWELPSGRVEEGEDINEALKREVLEETGLPVLVIGPELTQFGYRSRSGRQTIQRTFVVLCGDGRPMLSEHDAYGWFGTAELSSAACSDESRRIASEALRRTANDLSR